MQVADEAVTQRHPECNPSDRNNRPRAGKRPRMRWETYWRLKQATSMVLPTCRSPTGGEVRLIPMHGRDDHDPVCGDPHRIEALIISVGQRW